MSNAQHEKEVVRIYRTPDIAVPKDVSGAVESVLASALNVLNRGPKYVKFCSESSEDAVTWTAFVALQQAGRLREVLRRLTGAFGSTSDVEPRMLLWGVPVPSDDAESLSLHNKLIEVSNAIGEDRGTRSEPDVVLDFGMSGIAIIEVKHGSQNEHKVADFEGWDMYLENTGAFRDPEKIRASGTYELARNWRIAWDLARGRPLLLVNLGPAALLQESGLEAFSSQLIQDKTRKFQKIDWNQFRGAIGTEPDWLTSFLDDRGIF